MEQWVFASMCVLLSACILEYLNCLDPRGIRSIHNSSLQSHAWLVEMLNKGSPIRCCGFLRMLKHVFFRLCYVLRERNCLKDSRFVSVEEQVAMFLMIVGH